MEALDSFKCGLEDEDDESFEDEDDEVFDVANESEALVVSLWINWLWI